MTDGAVCEYLSYVKGSTGLREGLNGLARKILRQVRKAFPVGQYIFTRIPVYS